MVAVSSSLGDRRFRLRALAAVLVVALLVPVGVSALTYEPADLQAGTVVEPAEGPTVVGIQGFHFRGQGSTKKPARLVSIGPSGDFQWQFDGSRVGARWFYDVDPLPGGDLLVTSTNPDGTVVTRLDGQSRDVVWTEELPYTDTHDVDWLGDGELLVANMRQWDEEAGVSDDRLLVYDRAADAVVWEWRFREHYPNDTDGGFGEDWTHVNDVDRIEEGLYLASPRNFDQAIVVNRETGEIEARLGADDRHGIISEQHNPDYLEGEDGTPTILVADSENDRVVEYERTCEGAGGDGLREADPDQCAWELTWAVGTGQLNWPRDADRLPNGNTLITDTLNHRVIEVTPEGRIVWEYYATWGPYDAERVAHGDGSSGPTMADQGVSGSYRLTNSAGALPGTGGTETFHGWLTDAFAGTPVSGQVEWFARGWAHVTPWLTPRWMSGWDLVLVALAGLVLAGWGATEAYHGRRRIRRRIDDLRARVTR